VKPTVFIGSSVEGKDALDVLVIGLEHDIHPRPWHNIFLPS
jgi:hypothetical protein